MRNRVRVRGFSNPRTRVKHACLPVQSTSCSSYAYAVQKHNYYKYAVLKYNDYTSSYAAQYFVHAAALILEGGNRAWIFQPSTMPPDCLRSSSIFAAKQRRKKRREKSLFFFVPSFWKWDMEKICLHLSLFQLLMVHNKTYFHCLHL